MLDVAFGEASTSQAVSMLLAALRNLDLNGTLYIGYPLLNVVDGRIKLDALLTCQEHGVVAFDLSSESNPDDGSWNQHVEQLHSDIFVGIENKLREHRELRNGRRLAFDVHIITLVPSDDRLLSSNDVVVASPNRLPEVLKQFPPLHPSLIEHINAAIQTTTTLKPKKKRVSVKNPTSKGSSLKIIERQIANFDRWQKKAAIEFPENPQRIRGLAGSGKTIVLAQKAALLHARFPEWNILVTFNTRSLYQQFEALIRKFCFELIKDDPDWSKLKISHAWGSLSTPGVYSEIARANGSVPRDFSYAKAKFGAGQSFAGVCAELLHDLKNRPTAELFDVVLIDEAQDFPTEFFQIIYTATKSPKRIVWAYDELQNLGDYSMPPAEVLFGSNPDGTPKVRLQNQTNQPMQDIILRVCYRNTPWALATAHALGFGIYRAEGLVQMFDEAALWNDIGYTARGALKAGLSC